MRTEQVFNTDDANDEFNLMIVYALSDIKTCNTCRHVHCRHGENDCPLVEIGLLIPKKPLFKKKGLAELWKYQEKYDSIIKKERVCPLCNGSGVESVGHKCICQY